MSDKQNNKKSPPVKKIKLSSDCLPTDEHKVVKVNKNNNPSALEVEHQSLNEDLQPSASLNKDGIQRLNILMLGGGDVVKSLSEDKVQPACLNAHKAIDFSRKLNEDRIQPAQLIEDKFQHRIDPFLGFNAGRIKPAPFHKPLHEVVRPRMNRAINPASVIVEQQANLHPKSKMTDACYMCRDKLNDLCIKCHKDKDETGENEKCDVVWGKCGHALHLHCFAL